MKKILMTIGLVALAGPALAAGDAAAGKAKGAICTSCHGANGVSIAGIFPNLAGQKEEYLLVQLKAFKDGSRNSANAAQMAGQVAGLSEQDMEDLAAFFSSMDAAK